MKTKRKREALHCRSLHASRSSHYLVSRNEQQEKPHAIYDMLTTRLCPKLPLAYEYTNGCDTMRAVHTNTTKGHSPLLLSLTYKSESCEVSMRQNQSVVNAFQYVLSPTRHIHKGWWREQRCEISANSAKKQELAPKCRKFAYNAYTLPPVFLTLYRNK